jgi:branched-chain amino acid transport system substrate-binding protein
VNFRRARRCALLGLLGALLLAPTVRAADAIRIGFTLPLTGGLAANGKAILIAYQMWAEDVNAKGGLLGRQVELVNYDDQSSPATVPGTYTKLIEVDKVDLVISSYGTNLTAPAVPVAMQHDYLFLGLFALAINAEFNYPNYFSMFPAGPDPIHNFSRAYFELAAEQQPKPQTVAIVGADSDFAKKAADGAHDNATALGFKIVYERGYPPNTVDFSPIIRAIQAANPDVVYVASYPQETVGIVRAANEVGLKTKLFGGGLVGVQYGTLKTQLGPLLNGIVVYDFYVPEPTLKFPGIEAFLARYQAKATGAGVDLLGYFVPPFAYANGQVLAQAIGAVGSLDQKKLADYIRSHGFDTVVGEVRFAANGEWAQSRILQVQFQGIEGNELAQFKRPGTQAIVYPKEYRSGTLRYPYTDAKR